MAGTALFSQFVDDTGGRAEAAKALGVSYPLVCHVLKGTRAISKELAERVEEVSEGKYSRADLFFGPDAIALQKAS